MNLRGRDSSSCEIHYSPSSNGLRTRKAVRKINFVGWHVQTLASHLSLTSKYQAQGFGFVTPSVYGLRNRR